jgi:hypothetical protein
MAFSVVPVADKHARGGVVTVNAYHQKHRHAYHVGGGAPDTTEQRSKKALDVAQKRDYVGNQPMKIFRSEKDSRRHRYLRLAYLIAPAILIASFAVGGSAEAATHAAAAPAAAAALRPCTFTNGTTSNLKLGHNGVVPVDGTYFTMPKDPAGTRCRDLNLSYVSATDHYEGWLLNSHTDRWAHCNAGFVKITKGHHSTSNPPVLCTDVLGGTVMAVVQQSNTRRSITVED